MGVGQETMTLPPPTDAQPPAAQAAGPGDAGVYSLDTGGRSFLQKSDDYVDRELDIMSRRPEPGSE